LSAADKALTTKNLYKFSYKSSIDSVVAMSSSSGVKFSNRLFPVLNGQVITVSGKSSSDAEVFEVKLTNARDIEDISDIHFNFLVNFKSKEIVRNSRIDGVWGKEEKNENLLTVDDLNPLVRDQSFKIEIIVYSKLFIVIVDDSPFCTFELHKPLREIQKLVVSGDVETIYGVDHVSKDLNPLEVNENQVWRGLIPTNFEAVNVIVFTGISRNNSGNFNVNFREKMKQPILLQLAVDFDREGMKFR
jgi:hypothetical protein